MVLWYAGFIMVWIILFIPLGIWLGLAIASRMNIFTLGGVAITVLIFILVETRQYQKDRARSLIPLWIMCLMLLSLGTGLIFR